MRYGELHSISKIPAAPDGYVKAAAFLPDGKSVLAGSYNLSLIQCRDDAPMGIAKTVPLPVEGYVDALCVSKDGKEFLLGVNNLNPDPQGQIFLGDTGTLEMRPIS